MRCIVVQDTLLSIVVEMFFSARVVLYWPVTDILRSLLGELRMQKWLTWSGATSTKFYPILFYRLFFFSKAWLSSFSFPQCSWLIFLPSNPLSNERKILLLHGIVLPGVPGPPTNLWGERKTASLYLQEQKQLLLFESQFISQSVGWKLELKSNFIDIEIKASVCCYFPRPHRSLNDEAPLLHHNLNRAAQLSLR